MKNNHKKLIAVLPSHGKSFLMMKSFFHSLRIVSMVIIFFILLVFLPFGIREYVNIYDVDAKFSQDVGEVKIDSNLKLDFNQPIIFFDEKNITFSPEMEFDFEISQDRKSLIINPQKSFLPENKYELNIKDIWGISGLKLNDRKLTFYTEKVLFESAEKIGLDIEGKRFSEFDLSKDKYIVPEVSRTSGEIVIVPKFTEGKYIDVSIANQVMTLFEDGIKVNEFLVSTGKIGMPTPLGTFSVKRKEINHWSTSYGLWMPFSMNFGGAYYIHELPYWPSGYREGENHLGMRVSHGCIRLGVGVAKYVFDWSEIGTTLYVH
ncbi:L,D-transpeptidase [Patescibacteria group bacterium]|nr:L,D-transpeptidase [Patescibacteria group bacterium]